VKIEFYRTEEGRCPVIEYLDGLNTKQAQKVAWTFRAVEMLNPVPAIYLQKMVNTDNLWEVRVSLAGNIFRLFGWMDTKDTLMLAYGFTKKTQATPVKEIATTERRKKDHEARKKK
jgi:phage-related protein